MAAGVTYWWFPDEEGRFLKYLSTTGSLIALPSETVTTPEELTPQPFPGYLEEQDPTKVYLALESMVAGIVPETVAVSGEHMFCINRFSSPVLVYRRGRLSEDGKLTHSNLSTDWDYFSADRKQLLIKSEAFRKWGTKILRWVRKATPDWHYYKGYRVTPRVKAAVEAGTLDIVP